MLVQGLVAQAFETNCYVVAPGPGEQCVVVDPGIGVAEGLEQLLDEYRLQPVAVLLTHGHLDHTFSVTPVCGARDIPAYVHPTDRYMLRDPAKALSMDLRMLFGGRLTWVEPSDVVELPDGGPITLAGLEITVDHAPGHTGGSVLFRIPGQGLPVDASQLCLSGDVLFAGAIGRTDLPGGDSRAMMASLRDKILTLPDDTYVLPGHGPATTIGRERVSNPFLLEVQAADTAGTSGPARGW